MNITRRRFLWSALGAATSSVGVTAIGLHEATQPQLDRIEIFLPKLPDAFDGFTIAQLTDFHYDSHFSRIPIEAGINIVNSLRPDLIALTGDFVTAPLMGGLHRSSKVPGIDDCAGLLAELRAPSGIFSVLGNHDEYYNPKRIIGPLQSAGIRTLRNQSSPIERQGRRFWIAGLNDIIGGDPDLEKTLSGIPGGETTILLCHEPDFADEVKKYPVGMQLSGHSHGGQVVLPLAGALYLPPMARKYPRGLRQLGCLSLYTSRGIGTVRVPVRLDCPPEVTLLTLRCGSRPPGAASTNSMIGIREWSPLGSPAESPQRTA